VQVGQLTSEGIEVLSGLQAGEQVVTAGVQHLQAGQTVRPWQRERGL
jgi:multidrug efflux pump subunit AcrA (membrane-fusion protein)